MVEHEFHLTPHMEADSLTSLRSILTNQTKLCEERASRFRDLRVLPSPGTVLYAALRLFHLSFVLFFWMVKTSFGDQEMFLSYCKKLPIRPSPTSREAVGSPLPSLCLHQRPFVPTGHPSSDDWPTLLPLRVRKAFAN